MQVTNNSPSAGYIAWTGVKISYKGAVYSIANGSTNFIYVYWKFADPLTFYGSSTFPTLGNDDLLVFLNKNGTYINVPNATILDGSLIVPESILTSALSANSVTGEKILAGSIDTTHLAANSVTANAIAAGSVSTLELAAGAVTATTVAASAIGANAIAAGAVIADKIAAGVISSNMIATAGLDAGVIKFGTMSGDRIVANSLTVDKIVAGGGEVANGNMATGKTATNAEMINGTKTIGSAYTSFGTGTSNNNAAENAASYVQIDMGALYRIGESRIYFYAGDIRHYWYKIKYSTDGVNWLYAVGNASNNGWVTSVPSLTTSSGEAPTINTFQPQISARYLRIYGNGNSVNTSNHIYEWELFANPQTRIHGGAIQSGTVDAAVLKAGTVIASNITFSGSLSGATGTFSGDLSAASGTFSGDLSGSSGAFTTGSFNTLTLSGETGATLMIETGRLGSGGAVWTQGATVSLENDDIDTVRMHGGATPIKLIVDGTTESDYFGNIGKVALQLTDSWLRMNPSDAFTSGIYCGTSVLRTDASLQVGAAGASFLASSNSLSYKGDNILRGYTGSIKCVYSSTSQLVGNITYNLTSGSTARIVATVRWVSGGVSINKVGTVFVESVTTTSASIKIYVAGGLTFSSADYCYVDYHVVTDV